MRWLLPLLVLVALITAPTAAAAPECARVALSGTTTLNPGTGTIDGSFTGTIGGLPAVLHSRTTIVGQEQRGAVTFLATSHTLTLGSAQFRTTDNARLVQTPTPGVFHAVSRLELVSGGSGFLVGVGSIDFRGGITATWNEIHGQVCL